MTCGFKSADLVLFWRRLICEEKERRPAAASPEELGAVSGSLACLFKQEFPAVLGNEHHVIFAVPLRVT
jgi:hypothetical protein